MERMTVFIKHLATNGGHRFYKFSLPLTMGRADFDKEPRSFESDFAEYRKRIAEQYQQFVPVRDFDIVCVSDAHTHLERLVFVGMEYHDAEDVKYNCIIHAQIGGEHTLMIGGGSRQSMRNDVVYLRRLAQINGYNFGGRVKDCDNCAMSAVHTPTSEYACGSELNYRRLGYYCRAWIDKDSPVYICPRCGADRGREQAVMYFVNGCDRCRTDFDRRCGSYRAMRMGVANKPFEEQRIAINDFRAGKI